MSESSGLIVNAWEQASEDGQVLALAGHSSFDEIRSDRLRRAGELVSELEIKNGMRGLEIGSGNGIVAHYLAAHCERLDCNDISQSFLNMARQECANDRNVHFFKIGASYLEFLPSESYDFGYSLNVFIHFNPYDIYWYLLDVARSLKPSGLFYFDACTLGAQTRGKFQEHAGLYRSNPANVRGFLAFNDPELITQIVEDVGLKVVKGPRDDREGWLKFLVRKPSMEPTANK